MLSHKIILAAIISLFSFTVFLFTLHPSISPYRDSGDLVVASKTLGIAHPPGYPVYVMSGKIASIIIPWGNIAYRINITSALFGALSVFFAVLIMDSVSMLPVFVALLFVFSPSFWRLSQVSEMYSLNALFAAIIIYTASRLGRNNLILASFLCGFASGNHQTIILIVPALLWLCIRSYGAKTLAVTGLFFIIGFSVYLFLPIRSFTGPLLNWGDPENLRNFLRAITRADYGGLRLHPEQSTFSWTVPVIFAHIKVYLLSLVKQFTVIGAILGIWGIYVTRNDRFFRYLLIALLFSGPGFIILSNLPPGEKTTLPILEPHLIMPGLIFIFFIFAACAKTFNNRYGRFIVVAAACISLAVHLPECNYRSHFFAYDYGRNLLITAEKNSFLFNPDDPTAFITSYLETVEKKRDDIRLIAYYRTLWGYSRIKKLYPEILPRREITSAQELESVILNDNRQKYSIYSELPGKFPPGYDSYPRGLLYRLSSNGEFSPSDDPFIFYRMRGDFRVLDTYDFFTNQVISYSASARSNIGLSYARLEKYDIAKQQYFHALSIDRNLDAAQNNMGILAYFAKDYDEAEKWFNRALKSGKDPASCLHNLDLVRQARTENMLK